MAKIHSHYEELTVARNASPEVIRAAYRSLSQKYHPDRNPGNTEATRIMASLNVAFEMLFDPEKRKKYDQWIATTEGSTFVHHAVPPSSTASPRYRPFTVDETKLRPTSTSWHSRMRVPWKDLARSLRDPKLSFARKAGLVLVAALRHWPWYGLAAFVIIALVNYQPGPPLPGPKPYVMEAPPVPVGAPSNPGTFTFEEAQFMKAPPVPARSPAYVRSAAAPNGQPWPASSDYVGGYPKINTGGLSTVTVDNTQNDSDVFVKLVILNYTKAYPVRQFFISSHGSFTVRKVTAGNYDIRYRDLSSGVLSRSQAFDLEEMPVDNGTEFSNITMTLYKVRDGNMQTYALAEDEF